MLTEQIWNEFVGAGQGVVEPKSFRNQAAVLRDVLLVLPGATAAITGGLGSLIFRGPEGQILDLRGVWSFLRMKQASEGPLLQP